MQLKTMPQALFGHRILVLLDPVTAVGLDGKEMELPDKRTYDQCAGVVRLVGDGKNTMQAREFPLQVKNGDRVLMSEIGFDPITIEGHDGTFRLCHGDDIIALL